MIFFKYSVFGLNEVGGETRDIKSFLGQNQGWCAETQLCFQHTFLC